MPLIYALDDSCANRCDALRTAPTFARVLLSAQLFLEEVEAETKARRIDAVREARAELRSHQEPRAFEGLRRQGGHLRGNDLVLGPVDEQDGRP